MTSSTHPTDNQTKASDRLEELCAERGYTLRGEPRGEGAALRARIEGGGDDSGGLLYIWPEGSAEIERLRWVHAPSRGGQLFAVPHVRESGEDWILLEPIEGIPLMTQLGSERSLVAALGSERASDLARRVGQTLRKLHEVDVPDEYGAAGPAGSTERWQTFTGYVAARLEHFSERLHVSEFAEDDHQRLLRSIGDLRQELGAFHPRQPSALNHGSLAWEHLWIDEDTMHITGLTGFDRACLRPGEADIAHILYIERLAEDEAMIRSLYRGYGAARTMDVQRRERFYRRLAALEELLGRGDSIPRDRGELVELAVP